VCVCVLLSEEEQGEVWYYSSRQQLEALMEVLDGQYWESDLYAALQDLTEEAHAHMDVTEELTAKARGNGKAYLTAVNGERFNPPPVAAAAQGSIGPAALAMHSHVME